MSSLEKILFPGRLKKLQELMNRAQPRAKVVLKQ